MSHDENDQKSPGDGKVISLYEHLERPVPSLQVDEKSAKEFQTLRSHTEVNGILELLWQKDPYTYEHSHRVADFSQFMGAKLGFSNLERLELYLCALLHDVGKVLTPDFVLKKSGPLTSEEFALMRHHTEDSGKIIAQIDDIAYLKSAVQSHHERLDGKGYPYGIRGDKIHHYSRIILVADTFDAMTSNRVYRKKLPLERTYQELIDCSGTQFDPEAVKAFIAAHQNLDILDKKKAA